MLATKTLLSDNAVGASTGRSRNPAAAAHVSVVPLAGILATSDDATLKGWKPLGTGTRNRTTGHELQAVSGMRDFLPRAA